MLEINKIYNQDCLEGMQQINDHSIDMILCDLPYGVTSCKWDSIIPFDQLWEQYKRIIKPNGAIVLTAVQPFTTALIQSNRQWFKYCWYWIKNQPTGFTFAKHQPMRRVEDIVVFYSQAPTYNPQGLVKRDKPVFKAGRKTVGGVYRSDSLRKATYSEFTNYPHNVLNFKTERGLHPTQKPVDLFEYLIRTYTSEGDIVLDNCIGSGTTAVAAIKSGRQYIGFETDPGYWEITNRRIAEID